MFSESFSFLHIQCLPYFRLPKFKAEIRNMMGGILPSCLMSFFFGDQDETWRNLENQNQDVFLSRGVNGSSQKENEAGNEHRNLDMIDEQFELTSIIPKTSTCSLKHSTVKFPTSSKSFTELTNRYLIFLYNDVINFLEFIKILTKKFRKITFKRID